MSTYNTNAQDYDEKYLRFVTDVSFDLKTPLTAIKGYSDLLLTENHGTLQGAQREFIQKIGYYVNRTNKILELNKKKAIIESGILRVEKEPVDLSKIVDEVVAKIPKLESNYQTLQVYVDANLPSVKARFYEVYDVLSGLLEEIISHSLPGAKLSLSVGFETNFVRTNLSSSNYKYSSENKSEAVNPFDFTKFIFKQYVEQFDGEFGEESEARKGYTVWFTLPIADEQTAI